MALVLDGSSGILLPSGTTAERPSNPQPGFMRFNTTLGLHEYYSGTAWVGSPTASFAVAATPTSPILPSPSVAPTIPPSASPTPSIDILVVGGGGSASKAYAFYGAGGGGGAVHGGSYTVTAGVAIAIVVGAGGASNSYSGTSISSYNGLSGSTSSFGTSISVNGGAGGLGVTTAAVGGSSGSKIVGATTTPGFSGGALSPMDYLGTISYRPSGGGGGAGGIGAAGTPVGPGRGGPGVLSDISGVTRYYGGGGNGYAPVLSNMPYVIAEAPLGGGGYSNSSNALVASEINTGGGGGGTTSGITSGAGSSGVVFLRYPVAYPVPAFISGGVTSSIENGYRIYRWTSSGVVTF